MFYNRSPCCLIPSIKKKKAAAENDTGLDSNTLSKYSVLSQLP